MLPPSSWGLKESRDGRGKQRKQTGRTKTYLRKKFKGELRDLGPEMADVLLTFQVPMAR